MRFIWALAVVFLVAAIVAVNGCGGGSGGTPSCGNSDTCQASDPICARGCGRNQSMLCQCGTGPLEGTLVCGPCEDNTGSGGAGTGGMNGTAGRMGQQTGGAMGTAGRAGRGNGGRMGRGATGGATAAGGRMGRGVTGGAPGTGGALPSDGGIAICPADVQTGTCAGNATPICQTACVNGMYNICTCGGGMWLCPTNQIPCT